MTDDPVRPPSKKTEMIEVRVSHETKRAFLEACRGAGRTASDVIRESIDDFIDQRRRPQPAVAEKTAEEKIPAKVLTLIPKPMRKKRYIAAGAALAGLSLLTALPSAAAPDLAAAFRKLDANGDGVLTDAEFSKREAAGVKQMSLRQLKQDAASAPAADPSKPMIFIVPAPTDGKPVSDLMRDVRFQAVGGVSAAENKTPASFGAYDANKNGSVDLNEFLARQKLMLANGFATLDKDGNGGLDAKEYSALAQPLMIYAPDAILEFGVTAQYGPLVSPATLEAEFAKHDADRDGKVSLKEYLPPN
jgi:Ca2+-binding EF-hand superfamily protein